MDDLATALADGAAPARLRALIGAELERGARELGQKRSGYEHPVLVAVGPAAGALRAVAPAAPALRADPDAVSERTWLLVAALVGALVEVSGAGADRDRVRDQARDVLAVRLARARQAHRGRVVDDEAVDPQAPALGADLGEGERSGSFHDRPSHATGAT